MQTSEIGWTTFVDCMCSSVCLSVCLTACLSVCLAACLSVCLSCCLSVCLSVLLSVCCLTVSVLLSVCLAVCLSYCQFHLLKHKLLSYISNTKYKKSTEFSFSLMQTTLVVSIVLVLIFFSRADTCQLVEDDSSVASL